MLTLLTVTLAAIILLLPVQGFSGIKKKKWIRCLANYKSEMEFSNKDFNVDKVHQCDEDRKGMTRIYKHQPS